MIYAHEGPNGELPPFADRIEELVENISNTQVDLSWLEGYDLDMMDAIESYMEYQVLKSNIDDMLDKSSPFEAVEDSRAYAEGVGCPTAEVFSALRKSPSSNEPLFVIIELIAERAYKCGVRDAYEGRLSESAMSKVSQQRAKAEKTRSEMRELYDDLRES